MQATDLFSSNPLAGPGAAERLADRVRGLGRELPSDASAALLALLEQVEPARDVEALRDVVSTRLMQAFRDHQSRASFGLLYELNGAQLLTQVAARLRRYGSHADPVDVLQEVFFNVYRYPHRFDATRDDAFRMWSAMIVRNTVLKHLRALGRNGQLEVPFEDSGAPELHDDASPLRGVLEAEESRACSRAYVTYLQLYLRVYSLLSERERRALHLVEVDRLSYREAAETLDLRIDNLKMVIFRARRKIHRTLRRVLDGTSPDAGATQASSEQDEHQDRDPQNAEEARR